MAKHTATTKEKYAELAAAYLIETAEAPKPKLSDTDGTILEVVAGDLADSKGSCSFSSWSSQRIVDRVMSESEDVSPRNSGRSSYSSGPMAGASSSTALRLLFQEEENRSAQQAQLQACVSVAALAGVAAAKAFSSCHPKDQELASAVAGQCFKAAEALGADINDLESVVSSAVNVQSVDSITALTAAATKVNRKHPSIPKLSSDWDKLGLLLFMSCHLIRTAPLSYIASVGRERKAMEKGPGAGGGGSGLIGSHTDKLPTSKLLKRTRKGDLHWKDVSVYINPKNKVILKMKSKYVAKKVPWGKEYTVLEVVKDMPAWAGRHLLEDAENRRYFGLKTTGRGLVEFECTSQMEYEAWTDGVSRLISLAAAKRSKVK